MLMLDRPFGGRAIITQEFGPTDNDKEPSWAGYPHFHRGVDYALPEGTPQRASATGTVVLAGWDTTGYGNTVVIDVGLGITVRVAHLSVITVRAGQLVRKRDKVGETGTTGNSTGPHCHWEVCSYGAPIHPQALLDPTAPAAG